ncbi:MAG: hypothetical protein HC800_23060 [Phormidesmis sp. RL_2_1]|nr:hypothetical protein [Phormidesmis sp. RL_2_1]
MLGALAGSVVSHSGPFWGTAALITVISMTSCSQLSTNAFEATADFEATVKTAYTWQVEYLPRNVSPDRPNDRRLEQFESTTLVTTNGIRPDAAGSGPDSQGLWWPVLPPQPTVDDIEDRRRSAEVPGIPEVIKSSSYTITFNQAGEAKTLPTNYDVYRQAVKAFEKDRPLALILGPQDQSVLSAEIK